MMTEGIGYILAAAGGGFVIDGWDVAISIGLLAGVTLLVLALFGQKGTVELSPQREAALATGHSDRKTVFESKILGPILWVILMVCYRLAMPRAKAWISAKLSAAGNPEYYTAEEYLALAVFTGLVIASFISVIYFLVSGEISLVFFVLGMVVGAGLTLYQVYERANKRLHVIARRLPYALDLISLAMGAGATFTEAVRTVVQEDSDDPLNAELKAVLAEVELGTPRRKAMENFADRITLDGVRTLVASAVQAEELGTPLYKVLHDQATLLRLQRSVHAENAAAVASVRILVPGLLMVVATMLVIFGPTIMRGLQGGLF